MNSVFDMLNFKYHRNGQRVRFRNLFHIGDGSQSESIRKAEGFKHRTNESFTVKWWRKVETELQEL